MPHSTVRVETSLILLCIFFLPTSNPHSHRRRNPRPPLIDWIDHRASLSSHLYHSHLSRSLIFRLSCLSCFRSSNRRRIRRRCRQIQIRHRHRRRDVHLVVLEALSPTTLLAIRSAAWDAWSAHQIILCWNELA